MHISLAAEHLFEIFGLHISNAILTAWLVIAALVIIGIVIRKSLSIVPGKFQSVLEMVYLYFLDSAETIIGRRDVARDIFPYVITLFLFITLSNWSELLPGNASLGLLEHAENGHAIITPFLRPPSTDLNLVAVMALMSVAYVQYIGLKYSGVKNYLGKFFNFTGGIAFFVGILELFSEFTRIVSFTFRLFGNIFAGEVLVTVIFYLTIHLLPFFPILPLPFYFLELFVGAIQAFVFSFLVIVLTAVAVAEHGGAGHGEAASSH
jgi:F-type H+-transporting ATPase subunit a